MRATIKTPLYCECGFCFFINERDSLVCQNAFCEHHGKEFRQPTVEVQLLDAEWPNTE